MDSIALIVPTTMWQGWRECWESWQAPSVEPFLIDNSQQNWGVMLSLEYGYRESKNPLLAYIHDDVICREPGWQDRVIRAFSDPKVGLVGFGGAVDHGSSRIYKDPYDFRQLGRSGYLSNVDDAEIHGSRFTGEREVSVLDGFAMVVRREILDATGGWPVETPIGYVGYDYWLCCMAHRLQYKILLIGIRCHHLGGRSAVKVEPEFRGDFDAAHRYIYQEFKDVLPWRA